MNSASYLLLGRHLLESSVVESVPLVPIPLVPGRDGTFGGIYGGGLPLRFKDDVIDGVVDPSELPDDAPDDAPDDVGAREMRLAGARLIPDRANSFSASATRASNAAFVS